MRSPKTICTLILMLLPLSVAAQPANSSARRYSLREILELAQSSYPGVEAARQAVVAMEQEVFRARWGWAPQGNVRGLLAPAPEIKCFPSVENCQQTSSVDINSFNVQGVLARIELEMGMPLYSFGKLSSAKRAAAAGLEIKKEQVRSAQEKVTQAVVKAYWGLKLAREILATIDEGQDYLTDALQKVQKGLDEDEGDYTMNDLLRLKTAAAEVDARRLEAQKLETLTMTALAMMIGLESGSFDVDTSVLEVLPGEVQPLTSYQSIANQHRPEVKILEQAVKARYAAVDLERARFFPDFLLVAMVGYSYASSVDDPQNAFYSDPFNFTTAGFGLALNWKFDQLQQYGKFKSSKAEALETKAQQSEALIGINLEITKARTELLEAQGRHAATKKGEKAARQWLVATVQNLSSGLSEPRDLVDALVAYFQLRLRFLQAIYDVNTGWSEMGRVIGTAASKTGQR